MLTDRAPLVTLAMPVYNGQRYMASALDALLAQTFTDFEIVIVDNASTDQTAQIAESYTRRDARVRYVRNEQNIGAAPNFNRAFSFARGRYFKWAAHDDLCAPTYLAQAVAALEANPDLVLCQARVRVIDGDGQPVSDEPAGDPKLGSERVPTRLQAVMATIHGCFEVFGVIRASALRRTALVGRFPAGDKVLLAELALLGPFAELPDAAFLSRDHPARYTRAAMSGLVDRKLARESLRRRTAWFDPSIGSSIIFPQWRVLQECGRAVLRHCPSWNARTSCFIELARYARWFWPVLQRDLRIGARELVARLAAPFMTPRAGAIGPSRTD